MNSKDTTISQNYYGFYRGIVIDNADPDSRGRVKVFLPEFATSIINKVQLANDIDYEVKFVGTSPLLAGSALAYARSVCKWAEQASPLVGAGSAGYLANGVNPTVSDSGNRDAVTATTTSLTRKSAAGATVATVATVAKASPFGQPVEPPLPVADNNNTANEKLLIPETIIPVTKSEVTAGTGNQPATEALAKSVAEVDSNNTNSFKDFIDASLKARTQSETNKFNARSAAEFDFQRRNNPEQPVVYPVEQSQFAPDNPAAFKNRTSKNGQLDNITEPLATPKNAPISFTLESPIKEEKITLSDEAPIRLTISTGVSPKVPTTSDSTGTNAGAISEAVKPEGHHGGGENGRNNTDVHNKSGSPTTYPNSTKGLFPGF